MLRVAFAVAVVIVLGCVAAFALRSFPRGKERGRVGVARGNCEPALRKLCSDAALPYPPREIFLRVLKFEQRLELWAREDRSFIHLKSYPFTCFSGEVGPKRREGDRQIPEGLYFIDRFNPQSLFHLSLGLNYPNASDRILSDRDKPGSDIFIHGGEQSIGCVALGDAAMEELFVLALDTTKRGQREIPVHIFPAAIDSPEWAKYRTQYADNVAPFAAFWENLAETYRTFEKSRKLPAFEVDSAGRYVMKPAP